jgi:hypothetical protein
MEKTTMYLRLRLPTASSDAAAVRLARDVHAVRQSVGDAIVEARVLRRRAAVLSAEREVQPWRGSDDRRRPEGERRRAPRPAA